MKHPHHDRVLIVGDGPSAARLRSLTIPQQIFVIAVNGVVRWLRRSNAFFTLDPSPRNQAIMRRKIPGVQYYAAVPADYGTASARCHSHRYPRAVTAGVTLLQRIPGDGPCSSKDGMCRYDHAVHSGNSAWGALGLAHHFGASRIGLAGVDGTIDARISGGRPGPLDHLGWLFSTYDGAAEIRVGNPCSTVNCFERVELEALLDWLAEP